MNDLLHAFPGQEANEPVYVFARAYPVAFLPSAFVFLLVFLFSLLGQVVLSNGVLVQLPMDQVNIGILSLGVFQLFVITVFMAAVLDFYFDIVIVTDRRMVDIDQEMLFYRKISTLSLTDVEDVTSIVRGLLPTVFDYGQVEAQTAGARDNFSMDNVHFPREITSIVQDLSDQAQKGIPEVERVPESDAIGIINNQKLTTMEQLKAVGAILPDDFRRVNRTPNAAQPVSVPPPA